MNELELKIQDLEYTVAELKKELRRIKTTIKALGVIRELFLRCCGAPRWAAVGCGGGHGGKW